MEHTLAILAASQVAFSPVKLALLMAWFYLCLYTAQRIQFTMVVPMRFKSSAQLASLLAGPFVPIAFIIANAVKRSIQSEESFRDIITEHLQSIRQSIDIFGFSGSAQGKSIELLDSSGRNIKDIYGHGKIQKTQRRVLNYTHQIIYDALQAQASDILIDPQEGDIYNVRFRVDGVLRIYEQLEGETSHAVVNSIKAVSNMDIAEKRRPQDGAFIAEMGPNRVSFRIASAGALHGEKISIRILNQSLGKFQLENIGMTEKQQRLALENIEKPSGMILISGPTGTGKTTTLYAMLDKVDLLTRNVVTVEDPVEYVLENASQIEINPKAGITFAKSLRSILRQDPDIICVGEIRDEETAAIALRAAQTGQLVLATIHCNSNASAMIRLLDLGISPVMLATGLNLVISQRLVRLLCEHCKAPAQLTKAQINDFTKRKINYMNICQPVGCKFCSNTGFKGRFGIFDLLPVDNQIKNALAHSDSLISQMRENGDKKGKSNLQKQALKLVVTGRTSLDEVKRVLG